MKSEPQSSRRMKLRIQRRQHPAGLLGAVGEVDDALGAGVASKCRACSNMSGLALKIRLEMTSRRLRSLHLDV